MLNHQRSHCDTLYESVELLPMWRRCLRYRPRTKDFRALLLPRDRIRQIRSSARRLWPCGIRNKHLVPPRYAELQAPHNPRREVDIEASTRKGTEFLASDTRKALALKESTASTKTSTQMTDPKKHLVPISFSLDNPTLAEPLEPFPLFDPTIKAELAETGEGIGIGTALSSRYTMNYQPHQPNTPLQSIHEIGMALTTSQKVSSYSGPQQDNHDDRIQQQTDEAVHDSLKSKCTSPGNRSQNKHKSRSVLEEATGAGLVDISTLVPEYFVSNCYTIRKPALSKRSEDTIQYHPSLYSSPKHDLVQVLEVQASRQGQKYINNMEETEKAEHLDWVALNTKTPRNSKRCGQFWNGEETRNSFLAIEALNTLVRNSNAHLSQSVS